MSDLSFRAALEARDVDLVRQLARDSGGFSLAEVDLAAELAQERLARGLEASGYHFLFAQWGPGVPALGYVCYGPIPLTQSSWDLYWIAVAKGAQRRGIGRRLLAEAERRANAAGAGQFYIDTSGRPDYASSRAFYAAAGYHEAAALPDFYAPGDAKVIFAKQL